MPGTGAAAVRLFVLEEAPLFYLVEGVAFNSRRFQLVRSYRVNLLGPLVITEDSLGDKELYQI